MSVHAMYLQVLAEARKWCQIPWSWSYGRWLHPTQVLGTKFSGRATSAFSRWALPSPLHLLLRLSIWSSGVAQWVKHSLSSLMTWQIHISENCPSVVPIPHECYSMSVSVNPPTHNTHTFFLKKTTSFLKIIFTDKVLSILFFISLFVVLQRKPSV